MRQVNWLVGVMAALAVTLGGIAVNAAQAQEANDPACLTAGEVREWFNTQPPMEIQAGPVVVVETNTAEALLRETGFPLAEPADGMSYFEANQGMVLLFPTMGGCVIDRNTNGPAADTAISGPRVPVYFKRMSKQGFMAMVRGI